MTDPGRQAEPGSNQWAQEQAAEFATRRDDYVLLGKVLDAVLRRAVEAYAPSAIVQVRAKTIPSFAEKCLRKGRRFRRPVDEFTDLCGARVIVHTQEQVERISRFLEEHFEIDWANSEDTGRRLQTAEFGYQSVHYIVTFKRGVFPTQEIPVEVPPVLFGGEGGMPNPRAEVQVRTLLQHAWADTGHDLLYKGGFQAPEVWKREYARLAAALETADDVVSRVHEGMHRFISSYRAYMTPAQMESELALLDFVRRHDPENAGLALRIAGIANAAEKWEIAIEALERFEPAGDSAVLRELGIACCGWGREAPRGPLYQRGQDLLARAARDRDAGAPALLALATSWRGVDDEEARAGFARVFEALPHDPHALAGYLEYEIGFHHDLGPLAAARPAAAALFETCEARVVAGVDIPGAFFVAGFLQLLLARPYAALDSYARGVQLSTAAHQIEEALDGLRRIKPVAKDVEGHAWIVRLLELALAANGGSADRIRELATRDATPMTEPVLMVAGGCDPAYAEQFEGYRRVLVDGLAGFCGTVIGGGTRQGISGFVGDAAERNPAMQAISYLPELLPLDAILDPRYAEVRPIDDAGFTPMGPLQAWTDLIAAGVEPGRVRLLGINGGRVAAAEYRIALALGAIVALVEDSGREAARLLPDEQWGLAKNLHSLPADWSSVRSYVGTECVPVPEELLEAVARDLHDLYRREKERELRSTDPAIAPWDELIPEFRESSLANASDVFAKLAHVGLEAVPAQGAEPAPYEFPGEQVELLAEMEHGRWNAERLLAGWRYGPVRDASARLSPWLVPWSLLPEHIREYDRIFVRGIPVALARHGYGVRKKD